MSRNTLEPGTATESQTEGLRAPGQEKPAETSQTAIAASLSGHSPLSHGTTVRWFTSAEIREAVRLLGERDRRYFRKGGRLL